MNILRRTFLKTTLATGGAILGASLLPHVLFADWPKPAFDAKTPDTVIKALFDNPQVTDSDKITITTPPIAENGAIVPIEIAVDLPKVESIAILGDKNPVPLLGQFTFADPDKTIPWVKTRIKLSTTSNVIVVVKADGKFYQTRREVKVTVGGCGQT